MIAENDDYFGITDEPAKVDKFEIGHYYKGLVEFIKKCNTPMTISIQGGWGTGKTTIMHMVEDELKSNKKVKSTWLNTWQFAQLCSGEELPYVIAASLLDVIVERDGIAGKIKTMMESDLGRISKKL